jgi:hypothetical protein
MFSLSRVLKFLGRTLRLLSLIFWPILILAFIGRTITERPERWLTPGFWVEVGLHVVPFIVIIMLVYWLAGRFVRDVYRLKSIKQGVGFLLRCQVGQPNFSPWLLLTKGKVGLDLDGLVLKLGGPGGLIIHNDTAVVLEQAGRLTRVAGPGFPTLKPFEAIYDIIDLRPKRRVYTVSAMTKEGIAISWDVEVHYKIGDDEQKPTEQAPYPFSQEAIFRAATGKWRREIGRLQDMDWEGWLIISQTEGLLRSILARRFLDELIGLSKADRIAAREAIQAELERGLSQVAPELGAKILQVRLNALKVGDEVTRQWIEDWQNSWQQWSENQLAQKKAKDIQTHEPIKTQAELMLIESLTQALRKVGSDEAARSLILMRLFDAIGQVQIEGENHFFLPAEAFEMLEKLTQSGRFYHNGEQPVQGDTQGSPDKPKSDSTAGEKTKPKEPIPFRPPDIPIVGQIAAGQGQPFQAKDALGYIQHACGLEFRIKGQDGQRLKAKLLKGSQFKFDEGYDYFALEVLGDSMDRAGIACGDYVILRKPKGAPVRPKNGDIVAAIFHSDNHTATLKRIYFGPKVNGIILQPESSNPVHQPRTLSKQDFAGKDPNIEVEAVVIAVLKPQSMVN